MYPCWTSQAAINSAGPRAAHSCDFYDGKLWVFGGWNGKNALNDLWTLDIANYTWAEVNAKDSVAPPSPRNNHATAVVDSKLLLHGGHDGQKWLNCLHIFDFKDRKWRPCNTSGHRPAVRACHTLTRVNWKLYMFGGYDGQSCFNELAILDLETMTWTYPTIDGEQPQARNAHTMTAIGHSLYLCGGHSGLAHLTDLHVLQMPPDVARLEWSQPIVTGVSPPGLRGHSATCLGQKIIFFGGYDGKGRSNELFVLDAQEKRWLHPCADSENIPVGRQRHSACLTCSKKAFIFGGFDGTKWLDDIHVLNVGRLEENYLHHSQLFTLSLVSNLEKLLQNQEFADICFVVENRRIWAHKAIVIAQCDKLREVILGANPQEKEDSNVEESSLTRPNEKETEIHLEGYWKC